MQVEPVLLGELDHLAHVGQVGVGAVDVELADRHVLALAQHLLEEADDRRVLGPGRQLAARAVGPELRHDHRGRCVLQHLGALVVRARHHGALDAGLLQDLDHLLGRHDLPGVVAVVHVGVEDRQLLVGRGRAGSGEQTDEGKKSAHVRSHQRRARGRPPIVEANRDALAGEARRRHFVAQPALEQHQIARLGRQAHEGVKASGRIGPARRRRHVQAKPRILELQRAGALGHFHVIGAADEGRGMEMQGMHHACRHDVGPAVGHGERPAGQDRSAASGRRPWRAGRCAAAGGRTAKKRDAGGRASRRTCSRRDSAWPTSAGPPHPRRRANGIRRPGPG